MLKSPVETCIQNVYNLCVRQVITSAHLYTAPTLKAYNPKTMWVKATSYAQSMDSFTPGIPTGFFQNLPPLIHYLSPLSTAPTIKKNKKK